MVQNLAQRKSPYLLKRGEGYYFRYVLPKQVAVLCPELPSEIKRTLKTHSKLEAIYKVSQKLPVLMALANCKDKAVICRLYALVADFDSSGYLVMGNTSPTPEMAFQAISRQQANQEKEAVFPCLSEVWSDFVSWKHWKDKLLKNNERMFESLIYFLQDRPVNTVTKQEVKLALESISRLPRRNSSKFKGYSIGDLSEMDIDPVHRLSSKSVKEHLKLCQGLFSSYLVKELGVLDRSPTEGISVGHRERRFACLSDFQVVELLKKSESKPEWFQWFLKLALYSGARRSEIAQLTSDDFRVCKETEREYFVIKQSKTKAGRRIIPLHPSLTGQGFLLWLTEAEGSLFPVALRNPNRVTEHFSSLISEHENDLGERVVFHSLRHTFITKVRASGISTPLVQQFVGHEKTGAGMTDRYTHQFPFKDLLKVLDVFKIDFVS